MKRMMYNPIPYARFMDITRFRVVHAKVRIPSVPIRTVGKVPVKFVQIMYEPSGIFSDVRFILLANTKRTPCAKKSVN